MKKALKYFAAALAAAILCLALAACGETTGVAGTKYNFKETTSSSHRTEAELSYNTVYKDSTLEVKDGEVIWTVGDAEYKMTYTMDGDKYVLAGEYFKQLGQALGQDGIQVAFYGQETESGFEILMVQTYSGGYSETYTFHFTAA